MKFINWWTNNYTIGGLYLVSILTFIFSLILLGSLLFGYHPNYKTKGGFVFGIADFEKGIPLDLQISSLIPDTSISLATQKGIISGDDPAKIREYLNDQLKIINNRLVTSDTTTLHYRLIPWNSKEILDDTSNYLGKISNMKIKGVSVHIQPENFMSRLILIFPIILQMLLIAFCSWRLGAFLHFIQNDYSFDKSNYKRLRNIGWGLIVYNLVLFTFDFLLSRFTIIISTQSTNNNFQSPLHLSGNPDLHYGYLYFLGGCIFLILASAFNKGHQLQNEQDLTI